MLEVDVYADPVVRNRVNPDGKNYDRKSRPAVREKSAQVARFTLLRLGERPYLTMTEEKEYEKTVLESLQGFQWIMRFVAPNISTTQLSVLLFVADRTFGWRKSKETITYSHFLEGIPPKRQGEDPYAGGLDITRQTLCTALAALIDRKILIVRKHRSLLQYEINLLWTLTSNTMALRSPKRLKELQTLQPPEDEQDGRNQSKNYTAPGLKIRLAPVKKLDLKRSRDEEGMEKSAFLSGKREAVSLLNNEVDASCLDDLLSTTSQISKSARSKRLSKWTTATAFAIWTDLEKEHHAGVTHFVTTKANRHALAQYGKKWIKANGSTENWLIYLEWCISNWLLIRAEKLAWMRDAPTQPSMPFFVRNSDRFERAHEEKAVFEAMSQMSLRDREVQRRVQRGVPLDLAEQEVDDRSGLAAERERLEAAARAVKQADISAYGREREAEATDRRKRRWSEAAKLTAPAPKGTFDEWT